MCWRDITAAHRPQSWPSDTLEPTRRARCWLLTFTSPNACTERGSTHREAEADTVQKSFIERVQLCLPHYAEMQSDSEVSSGVSEEDGGRLLQGRRSSGGKNLGVGALRSGQYNI